MASFPAMSIDPFLGGTISFTYMVYGDCDSLSCTSTFTVEPCAGHIFPTGTSCCNYLVGTAELENVCYKSTDATATVSNAIPGVFFYYTKVVAPSANFTIDVIQTKDCSGFKYFAVHHNQIMLFNEDCQRLLSAIPSESGIGQAHLAVTGAIPGATYVMSVKYNVKSIIGSTFIAPAPTCEYGFVSQIGGTEVPNSTGHINAVPGCTDNTPMPGYCTLNPIISAPVTTQVEKETTLNIYPNPFTKTAEITYTLANDESNVVLELVNMLGSKVIKLYEGPADAGLPYTMTLKAEDKLVEGVYFMVLTTGHEVKTVRVILSR